MRSRGMLAALALGALVGTGSAVASPPLTLREAMSVGREKAREVAAAEARRDAAAARERQAQGFRFPSVNVSELYDRTNSAAETFALKLNKGAFSFAEFVATDPNKPDWLSVAITRVEANLSLFTGGELSGRIAQAKNAVDAAARTVDWVGDNAALNAAEAYVMVAQAVIEKVALPIHAVFSGHVLFPVFDRRFHSRLARKRQDGVQMIRHQQAQMAMPDPLLMVVLHCCQHGAAGVCAAQLIFSDGHAFNGNGKPTAF